MTSIYTCFAFGGELRVSIELVNYLEQRNSLIVLSVSKVTL